VLVDPHTAVGIHAARSVEHDPAVPMVVLATAHPAKFPDAVEESTGVRPELPARYAHLLTSEERVEHIPADLSAVEAIVRRCLAR
jgi:threonine synthase